MCYSQVPDRLFHEYAWTETALVWCGEAAGAGKAKYLAGTGALRRTIGNTNIWAISTTYLRK